MWRPIIPRLAAKFTVIAADLPGIGDSDIPKDGLDMKSSAIRIHALAKSLGVEKARVVGHDIGLMVAYAYAAMYPNEVEKLVVMDAFLPGVEGWEPYYNNPDLWHFRFHGPTPEALVAGREKTYFAYFWNDLAADKTRSVPVADRQAYVAAYSRPGRMRAAWAYFAAWPQTANDFCGARENEVNDAGSGDLWRKGECRNADAADEARGNRRNCSRTQGDRTLANGRKTEGDHRRADEFFVTCTRRERFLKGAEFIMGRRPESLLAPL
jgi:pimeloyl-ACP methyl ester carboxylesterase